MTLTKSLAAFALAAFAAAAPAEEDYTPDPDEVRLFELLKLRGMAAEGIPESAARSADPIDRSRPENDPVEIKRRFAAREAERAAAFDRQFGKDSYARLMRFVDDCRNSSGCDKLAGGGLIEGAYKLRALEEDVAKKAVAAGSRTHRRRLKEILAAMAPYLRKLRPADAAKPEDAAARAEALEPIAQKALPRSEFARFMPSQKP